MREMINTVRDEVVRRVRRSTKEELAAGFFTENFAHLNRSEMDALVLDYWTRFRRLEEVLDVAGIDRDNGELRLLDIGGGYSTAMRLFQAPGRWVLDICIGELLRSELKMPDDIHWICGEGERVPFPDGFFDAVFCTNVLDHVEHPAVVLSEVRRTLRASGCFILLVDLFFDASAHGHHERDLLHPHTLTERELTSLIEGKFDVLLQTTQPGPGKVGLRQLSRGDVRPREDRQEHIFVLRRR